MTVVARALLALALAAPALAQDPALAAKLDRPTYVAVTAIVDSARLAKLPTRPLLDRALEGAAKGSDGQGIILAVHELSVRMASAKRGLAPNPTADEIKAGADAVGAGVSVRDLARLRSASSKRPVTMPLAVLTDLISRQVPIPTATDLVLQLARSGVKDGDFSLYQRNVRADIDRGAEPTAAATTRARGLVMRDANGAKKPTQ